MIYKTELTAVMPICHKGHIKYRVTPYKLFKTIQSKNDFQLETETLGTCERGSIFSRLRSIQKILV